MPTRKQIKFIERNRGRMSAAKMAARLGVRKAEVNEVLRRKGPPQGRPAEPLFRMPRVKPVWRFAGAALIATAALIAYSNSFTGEFVFDNQMIIAQNPHVMFAQNASKIWTEHYWAPSLWSNLYRPLTLYTYYINCHWLGCGGDPTGYHIVNLVIHATCGVLLFYFVTMLLHSTTSGVIRERSRLVGLCAALLFVTHPVTTEAVTNVVGRADLLVMAFVLAGLLLHMRGAEGGRGAIPLNALAAVCMALALLCKENAIAMIALVIALDVLFHWPKVRRKDGDRHTVASLARYLLRRTTTCYVFYFVVIGGWFFARYLVLRDIPPALPGLTDNPLPYLPFLQRQATAIVMLGLYLWRLAFPLTLSADYSYNAVPAVESLLDLRFLASLAALLAMGALAVWSRRRRRFVTFMVLWFFITIAPVSNIFVTTGTIGAERLLYASTPFWCALLALGAFHLFAAFRMKAALRTAAPAALLGALAVLFGVRTAMRNYDWESNLTLWRATYRASPNSVRAADNYARELLAEGRRGNLQQCRRVLEGVISFAGDYSEAYATLARVYLEFGDTARDGGRLDDAAAFYRKAYQTAAEGEREDVKRQLRERRTFIEWGMKESDIVIGGKWDINMALAHAALKIADIPGESAEESEREKLYDEAHRAYRVAVLARPQFAIAHIELAELLLMRAERLAQDNPKRRAFLNEAAVSLVRPIIMPPTPGILRKRAWENLGRCYFMLGYSANEHLYHPSKHGRYDFTPGKEVNMEFIRRAVKSLIMMQMANKNYDDARNLGQVAVKNPRYRLPPAEVRRILGGTYSFADEEIWYGGAPPEN